MKVAIVIAVHTLFVMVLAAEEPTVLTPLEMVSWAGLMSAIGGVAAAWRNTNEFAILAKTGFNTMVLGISLVLVSYYWTSQSAVLAWCAIGVSGLLSLGGLIAVDWAVGLAKKWLQQKVESHDNEHE